MVQEGCWVDSVFVQMTAWFLGLDILILTTSAKQSNPFIRIIGNITSNVEFSAGPPLLIGNYTNVHYQSLLPLSLIINQPYKLAKENKQENTKKEDFVYMNNGQTVVFQSIETDKLKCPTCGKSFQRLMNHISSKSCIINQRINDINELSNQLKAFKEGFRLEKSRKWKQNLRSKERDKKGEELYRAEQNNAKKKSRAKLKEEREKKNKKK